jgi:hypothetical protein
MVKSIKCDISHGKNCKIVKSKTMIAHCPGSRFTCKNLSNNQDLRAKKSFLKANNTAELKKVYVNATNNAKRCTA